MQKPRSVKSIIEQLRTREALLNRFCSLSNAGCYAQIAEAIESGQIFTKEFAEKI